MSSQSLQNKDETNCPNCGAVWDIYNGLGVCGYCSTPMPDPPPPPVVNWVNTTTGTAVYSDTAVSGSYAPGFREVFR